MTNKEKAFMTHYTSLREFNIAIGSSFMYLLILHKAIRTGTKRGNPWEKNFIGYFCADAACLRQ
jgi:hypothetical protein